MKSSPEIIAMLNKRLAEENAAVIQYRAHAAMCKNWGYFKLASYIGTRAQQELEHAEELQARILYLGGEVLTEVAPINVGNTVSELFVPDKESELAAIAGYIEGIELAIENKDFGTRNLLEHILEEEENHLHEIEFNMTQIMQMGIESYLSVKVEG